MATTPVTPQVYVRPVRKLLSSASPIGIGAGESDVLLEVTPDIVVTEEHEDAIVMTDNPIEQGAVVTDHAYNLPAELSVVYVWSPASPQNNTQDTSFLNTIYAQLLSLKTAITLFTVYTGKRVYKNMLIQTISETTDKDTENILIVRLHFREIIIVSTQTVAISSGINNSDPSVQAVPQKTSPIVPQGQQQLQPAPTFNTTAGDGS
jgi:hypothetical protein